MEKANIRVDPKACFKCYNCQLICSLTHEGAFNPLKARIRVDPGQISFTDRCVRTCSLCARWCSYGALRAQ